MSVYVKTEKTKNKEQEQEQEGTEKGDQTVYPTADHTFIWVTVGCDALLFTNQSNLYNTVQNLCSIV